MSDFVRLSAERFQSLVDYIRKNYADLREGDEITVHEPTAVNGIMFLPARYRGPEDFEPEPATQRGPITRPPAALEMA